jgi:hypothetical protein
MPPIVGAHVFHADNDDEQNDRDLNSDDGSVEPGTLADSDNKDRSDDQSDTEGREIKADLYPE